MTEKDKFKRDLQTLFNNCFRGKLHFNVWEDLNTRLAKDNELYKKYNFFWVTTLKAQLEVSQLHLIKLFDKSKKTVNIDHVINYAVKNKEKLFRTERLFAVTIEIDDFKNDIKSHRKTIDSFLEIRNHHFIHLSKEFIDDYNMLYKEYQELREDILEILILCGDFLETLMELAFDESKVMVLGTEYQTGQLIDDLSKS
jgi:hypothetical protein